MTKIFRRLKQRYANMKLQSKFTLILMLAVTVPVLMVFLFFYGRMYDMVVSYTIRQEQDASTKTSPQIEETVQEVLDSYGQLSAMPYYHTLFNQPVSTSFSTLEKSEQADEFHKQIDSIVDGELITGIRIYTDVPGAASQNGDSIFSPISDAQGTYWHGIFQGNHAAELFCPPFYLGSQEKKRLGDMAYIRSTSINYYGTDYPSYVAVYYSSDTITDILSDNLSLEGSVSYIINERNNVVASSNESLSGIYWLSYETIEDSFMSSNNFIERNIVNHKVYAGFYSINQPGWFMVTVLPSKPLIEQSNQIMLQFFCLYLVFLALALLLANSLSHSITNRISSVIRQMRKVRQGPPVPMESPTTHDEVGDLIDTYNYMTRKMNQLMAEQGKAAEDLRIAEFNSLQAQINPHFLYNTMDMINWLSQQGRTSEVTNAVQNLSRFYKLTLSQKKSISTIAQEEEHVSIYIHLQNMRYHDSIEFVSDIPDELMDYQIPKLTLQPVIENAILHGILEKDSKSGTIVLTGWMEDEDIVLLISDDGVGIPQEKLSSILTGAGQSASGGTNIAVYNTHRRIQILYGKSYGLSYSSEMGKGTEVQIRLPAQKEYQSPYTPKKSSRQERPFFPLVTVSSLPPADINTVSPESILNYGQQVVQDISSIQNMHQISEKFPSDENLYIIAHEMHEDFPCHTHNYFELNYVCKGAFVNVIDGNEVYMTAGDLVFLNREAIHELHCQYPDTLIVNFCLKSGVFQRTLKAFYEDENLISAFFRGERQENKNYIFFSLGHSLQAQSFLTSIIQEYADNGYHQSFTLESLFLLLFSYLVNAEEYSYYGIDGQTHQMIQYLQEHCLTETTDNIARHFQYTEEQMNVHLKTRTGRDCQSFIQEVRLENALKMLANPKTNIYQIVESCGYKDVEEFFWEFRKKFHISPTEYRRQFL